MEELFRDKIGGKKVELKGQIMSIYMDNSILIHIVNAGGSKKLHQGYCKIIQED